MNPKLKEDFRTDVLVQFLVMIDTSEADFTDDAQFCHTLQIAVTHCGIEPAMLAREFKVSNASISRWLSGKSAPRPPYRTAVVMTLRNMVENLLKESRSAGKGGIKSR